MKCTPYLFALGGLLLVMGCAKSPVFCTAEFRLGIVVTVVDSITGAPPEEATLIASSRDFVDSIGPVHASQGVAGQPPTLAIGAAGERSGTYRLILRSPGYHDWTRDSVIVTADACHVHTVTLTARLQAS